MDACISTLIVQISRGQAVDANTSSMKLMIDTHFSTKPPTFFTTTSGSWTIGSNAANLPGVIAIYENRHVIPVSLLFLLT